MNIRKKLPTLRPVITTLNTEVTPTPAEAFQNETLRPILKFQNDLLVAVYRNYIVHRKGKFNELKPAQQPTYILDSLRTDQVLINYCIGIVVGQFTQEEYASYVADEKQYRRRILSLLGERLVDQLVPR